MIYCGADRARPYPAAVRHLYVALGGGGGGGGGGPDFIMNNTDLQNSWRIRSQQS